MELTCEETDEQPRPQAAELVANVSYPATIKKVDVSEINDRDTGGLKKVLKWALDIDDPIFINDRGFPKQVHGMCDAKMTNSPDGQLGKLRRWAEAVLGMEIPIGMKLESDDFVGLPVMVKIWKRKGTGQYDGRIFDEISELLPFNGETEPPF